MISPLCRIKKKRKQIKLIEKEIRPVVIRGRGSGEGELEEGSQEVQTSPCNITNTSNVTDNIACVNATKWSIGKLSRVNPKCSHHKKIFVVLFFLCIISVMDELIAVIISQCI